YVAGAVLIGIWAPSYFVAVHVHPAKIVNALLALGLAGVWLSVRRGELSITTLRSADFATAFSSALGAGIGVALAPSGYFFELAGLLIFVVVMILRSAIVPSTGGFTLTVGLASAPCIVAGAYYQATTHAPIGF